jgi:DNA-directed RNA polymerase specialized sigma24 family protein
MADHDDVGRPVGELVPALRRTAYLLSGDWRRADEIVRLTLARAVADRRQARPADDLAAFLRAALVRCWSADRRRPNAGTAGRSELVRMLMRMPRRRRACVVLRYWERCGVEETARLLGCAPGVVRREETAGLHALLSLRPEHDHEHSGP